MHTHMQSVVYQYIQIYIYMHTHTSIHIHAYLYPCATSFMYAYTCTHTAGSPSQPFSWHSSINFAHRSERQPYGKYIKKFVETEDSSSK